VKAVREELEERAQVPRRLEHAQPLILRKIGGQQVEQLIHQQRPLDLDALGKEVEHLLRSTSIDVRLRQVEAIP